MSIARASKRRRLSAPLYESTAANKPRQSQTTTQHSWAVEQGYENRPRKQDPEERWQRLPIKNSKGVLEQPVAPLDDPLQSLSEPIIDKTPPPSAEPESSQADDTQSHRVRLLEAKEELARLASLINEAPEEHVGSLKALAQITDSKDPSITKLGLATQLSVYKDIIPGYRIRAISEEDAKEKVSQDVRRQRAFEQSIVRGYQAYVKDLSRIAHLDTSKSQAASTLVDVAFSCICNLLENVAHFNFRDELLKVVTDRLSAQRVDANSEKCIRALKNLFEADEDGNVSLGAVTMLARMIKAKHFNVNESVLNLFLHLRLLSEFRHKGSHTRIDQMEADANKSKPKLKMKREHRSKAERKILKERKAIEHEFREADATVGHAERDQNQSETLRLVFGVYFRVLKTRTPWLTGAVLEGLVKYAHLINQDFFGDLLEALRDLIKDTETAMAGESGSEEDSLPPHEEISADRNLTRESLLCVATAFGLLQGQDAAASASALGLDLQFFITHLYRALYSLALNTDIELDAKTLRAPDPNDPSKKTFQSSKINVSTTIVLYLRSLQSILLPEISRSVPPVRLAAFSKQLLTASLHMPERSCASIIALMTKVAKTHRGKISYLWHTEERRGDGVFDPTIEEIEGSNPFAGTAWDGELLRLHYSPMVRDGVRALGSTVDAT